MRPRLSEDQQLFQETTRRYLQQAVPLATVRSLEHEPAGFHSPYWRQGAELGWTSLLVREADGGGTISGAGLDDLALVAEEMGRLVSPGPLTPVNVVAAAVSRCGTAQQRERLLPGLLAGETVAAWAIAEPEARWTAEALRCTAVQGGDGFAISGVKAPVEAAAQSGELLVVAECPAGPTQFLVPRDTPGVTVTPLDGLDLTRRFAEVRLDAVRVPHDAVLGTEGGAAGEVERLLQIAAALGCAETCGAIGTVLDFTLDYLRDRHAFGRPLASYQALKHRLADMKMWLEACYATTAAAVAAIDEDRPERAETVSAAKSYVGAHATEIVQDCIQLHGGIGVTWEHDLHLYLRRVSVNRLMYGSPAQHRERIAALVGLGPGISGKIAS